MTKNIINYTQEQTVEYISILFHELILIVNIHINHSRNKIDYIQQKSKINGTYLYIIFGMYEIIYGAIRIRTVDILGVSETL